MLIPLPDLAASERLAKEFALRLQAPLLIFLHGELGAGKTTLVRHLLQACGLTGRVKSPTYSLLEQYDLPGFMVYHLDLYRLKAAGELEFLGIDEAFSRPAVVLIEWPEVARDGLPPADLELYLTYDSPGRLLDIQAFSEAGRSVLSGLESCQFT